MQKPASRGHVDQLLDAARVIEKTPAIRAFLKAHDPKALEQLERAMSDTRRALMREALREREDSRLADYVLQTLARPGFQGAGRRPAYPRLVQALRTLQARIDACELGPVNSGRGIADAIADECAASRALLRELGEADQ